MAKTDNNPGNGGQKTTETAPLFEFVTKPDCEDRFFAVRFDCPFKEEIYAKTCGDDLTPYSEIGTIKEDAEIYNSELQSLFKTKKIFEPFDWYNIFYESIHGERIQEDEDDMEDREELNDDEIIKYKEYACLLSALHPSILEDSYSKEEGLMKATPVTVQWIAANVLLGSKWIKPEVAEKEKHAAIENIIHFAKEVVAREKIKQIRLSVIRQKISRGFLARLNVERMRKEKVLNLVTANAEVKAKADRLLASFENATEFLKSMNAVELWAIVLKQDLLQLVMPWKKEELEKWNWNDEMPKIPDLTHHHTELLRALWDNRSAVSSLIDPVLIEAAQNTPRCTYKHFLVILNRGRQIYLDFRFLNPTMQPSAVRSLIFYTLQHTNKGPELTDKLDDYKRKAVKARRSSASYKKKTAAEAEVKATQEEEEKLKAKSAKLQKKLINIQKALEEKKNESTGTKLRGNRRRKSAEEATVEREIKRVEKQAARAAKRKQQKEEEAKAAEKEANNITATNPVDADIVTDAEPKKKRKKGNPVVTSLFELANKGGESAAPTRIEKKNQTVYAAPGKQWFQVACHQHTLWDRCRGVVKEASATGELQVDWGAFTLEDDEAKGKRMLENATAAVDKVGKLSQNGKLTPKEMMNLMKKWNDDEFEDIYVTSFVKKALILLEMISLEFVDPGTGTIVLGKIKTHHICNSLKTWLLESSERKQFYTILRVVEQLHTSRQLGKLKKLVNEKFNTTERVEMNAMLVLITQKKKPPKKNSEK